MPAESKIYLPLALVAAAIAGILLAVSFGVVPGSIAGWLMLFIIGIPAWMFLERLGDAALRLPMMQRLSSPARILIGVPLVITLMGVALLIAHFIQRIVSAS